MNCFHRICVNTSDADILHNFEKVTMIMKYPMWGLPKIGAKAVDRMKRDDLILFGHHKIHGFKYIATFVKKTDHNAPDEWTNKDSYTERFYITNIRRIETIPTSIVNSRKMTFPYSVLIENEIAAVAIRLLCNQ